MSATYIFSEDKQRAFPHLIFDNHIKTIFKQDLYNIS
jgi:hypothetical protein